MLKIRPIDYDHALLSQGACNLSGLIYTLAERLAERLANATDDPWNHPIFVLYMEQLSFLSITANPEVSLVAVASQGGTPVFPEELIETILAYEPGDFVTDMQFLLAMMKLVNASHQGTSDRNRHPVVSLIIARMKAKVTADWRKAYEACEREKEVTA